MKRVILATLAVVAMASCAKDQSLEGTTDSHSTQEITFISGIESRVDGNNWVAGDKVGFYSIQSINDIYIADNILYAASSSGSSTSFAVASGQTPLYFPEEADEYAVVLAYYPYDEAYTLDCDYQFDCTDQSDLGVVDFLFASDIVYSSDVENSSIVNLDFQHCQSLVKFYFQATGNLTSLEGLSVELRNIQTKGFPGYSPEDIAQPAENIVYDTIDTAVVNISDDKQTATVEMILFPASEAYPTDAELAISVGGENYTAPLITALESGKQHSFLVKVGSIEMTIGDSVITPWDGAEDDATDLPVVVDDGYMTLEQLTELDYTNRPTSNVWIISGDDSTLLEATETSGRILESINANYEKLGTTLDLTFTDLTSIPQTCFMSCNIITRIALPKVTSLPSLSLEGCSLLTQLEVATASGALITYINPKAFVNETSFSDPSTFTDPTQIDLTVGAANRSLVNFVTSTLTVGDVSIQFKSITVLND
ncbi:MAG: fimbrillin family protein [Rikenellaceae bacterium]